MKKSIFILAALCATTFAHSQIYLEKTFNGRVSSWLDAESYYFDCGKLPIVSGDTLVELYNDDMTLYKTVRFAPSGNYNPNIPETPNDSPARHVPAALMGSPSSGLFLFARNIFTTDGKVAFIRWSNNHIAVYDEDAKLVSDLQDTDDAWFGVFAVNGKWKLLVQESTWNSETGSSTYVSYVYSLPGTGDSDEAIAIPKSALNSSRKVLRNHHVLIESNGHTFDAIGQELR